MFADPEFWRQLSERIDTAIQDKMSQIVAAQGIHSYDQYMRRVGVVEGLEMANVFAEEVIKKMNGENNPNQAGEGFDE